MALIRMLAALALVAALVVGGVTVAARFADEWDQVSFDPAYDTLPLEHFLPMVREIFGRPPTML